LSKSANALDDWRSGCFYGHYNVMLSRLGGRGQGGSVHAMRRVKIMKQVIPSLLIGLNNSVIVVVCLYLILSNDITFQERGVYAGSSILFWMGVQRLIRKLSNSKS
jgi:prolipoprotein diacylglyceryltransferase